MSNVPPEYDYQLQFTAAQQNNLPIVDLVTQLTGTNYRINSNNRLFIHGIDDKHFQIEYLDQEGKLQLGTRRAYVGDEKMLCDMLAAETVKAFSASFQTKLLEEHLQSIQQRATQSPEVQQVLATQIKTDTPGRGTTLRQLIEHAIETGFLSNESDADTYGARITLDMISNGLML